MTKKGICNVYIHFATDFKFYQQISLSGNSNRAEKSEEILIVANERYLSNVTGKRQETRKIEGVRREKPVYNNNSSQLNFPSENKVCRTTGNSGYNLFKIRVEDSSSPGQLKN